MPTRPLAALALTLLLLVAGCGHKKRAAKAPPRPTPVATPRTGDTEEGIASWYGHPYHGRQAADGEIYDMDTLVAAHRTLPFNTWVRVLNLTNQKSVDVRIIDRGPFIDGRIIDLSHAAARAIELIGPGTAQVRVEVIRTPDIVTAGAFAVQVGAFRNRANAERLRADMQAKYGTAQLLTRPENPQVWRVLVGAEKTEAAAVTLSDRIRREATEKTAAFVVRVDSL